MIAAAFTKYIQVIKDLDLKPGKTPTAANREADAASQALDNAQVKAANEAVTKWATDNCSQSNP